MKSQSQSESIDPKLRRDIRELSTMLGRVLAEQESEYLFRIVEKIRIMTKSFRKRPTSGAVSGIEALVKKMSLKEAHNVARAFHLYFLLANAADEAHRIRLRSRRSGESGAGLAAPMRLALASLKGNTSISRAARTFLDRAVIRPVFTAHPTEATRQTMLQKLSTITQLIIERDRAEGDDIELSRVRKEIFAQITLLWQTSELRSNKVTVQDEVLRGLYFFSQVLFDTVPRLTMKIERVFAEAGADVRMTAPPVRLGSWMGGDRDGHPSVTARLTSEALDQHREAALLRYGREIESLYTVLSSSERIARIPASLRRWVRREVRLVSLPSLAVRTEPSEIYRWALRVIHAKLELSLKRAAGGYRSSGEFQRDVERLDSALRHGGADAAAEQYVRPLLLAIRAFGFSLVSLDVRESGLLLRSSMAKLIDGLESDGQYGRMTEEEKRTLLNRLLAGRRMVLPRLTRIDGDLRRIIGEFRMIAQARRDHEPSAIGAFILSNTEHVSDLLSVLLLAKEAGLVTIRHGRVVSSRIDIVPLFETIADLRRSRETLSSLFAQPLYRSHLRKRNNRQEIMIGYSDSAKDGGIVAAAYELYCAQMGLHAVAESFGVRPVFFHGRGGSISRGGGPVYESILAQPRETMTGEMKITEQGEMISAKYLIPEMALYSLELMTAATLFCVNTPLRRMDLTAREEYVRRFEGISETAREAYKSLTRHPDFWKFYSAATPLDIIEQIEIGSRPVSRKPRTSLESLRAIPWVFSWTQCRLAITGWYGFGTALEAATRRRDVSWNELRRMYRDWPFFRALINNIEMVLAKTDLIIGERYLKLAKYARSSTLLTSRIREEYVKSRQAILRIKEQKHLLERDDILRQSLQVRNPYLDPIHFIQIRFLREYRSMRPGSAKARRVLDLLRSSINGIASGMKNTG